MDNKSNPLDIPNYNYNNDNNVKHVCFSYPCYYCNKDVIQNFSTFSCLDKRISFMSNSFENSLSSYENNKDENKLSKSVDSETQTSLTFIDIEKYEMLSSSLLYNKSDISNNNIVNEDEDKDENENEIEIENEIENENEIFQMDSSDEILTNLNNTNYINNYDTYNSKYNNYFDPEKFDGRIDSLPDKVFLDVGEALLLEQSVEF